MVNYNLSHLTQPEDQKVLGPLQNDEALFLYSVIRCCRISSILEIGGGDGGSAINFLEAMKYAPGGIVYTCDIGHVPRMADNHKVIIKNALNLTPEDLDNKPVELVFFDCHDMVQMDIFHVLVSAKIITDKTLLALHDTNLHYAPYRMIGPYISSEGGYAHQPVERSMVNQFKELGYDILNLGTGPEKHSEEFPFRHGITICKKFQMLGMP